MGSLLRHQPNTLTMIRVVFALLFPFAPEEWWLQILIAALATEYLDGALSRRFCWQSDLGRVLDPIADKLFFVGVATAFFLSSRLTAFEIFLLGIRDWTVAISAVLASIDGVKRWWSNAAPNFAGKLTTGFQYLTFFSVLVLPQAKGYLVISTFVIGTLAAVQYLLKLKRGVRHASS